MNPKKEFETLVKGVLSYPARSVIRQGDPPRVTLIDFKSRDSESDSKKLTEQAMRLQVAIYGVAAKRELEY